MLYIQVLLIHKRQRVKNSTGCNFTYSFYGTLTYLYCSPVNFVAFSHQIFAALSSNATSSAPALLSRRVTFRRDWYWQRNRDSSSVD